MKIIHAANELKPAGRKVCLAIGFFDGVHLGHQQIIRQTIADAHQHDALALVLTFDRHPNAVVAPDHVPPLIYSLPQKLRAIESLGADTLLLIHFDEKFSRQTGEDFIRGLARDVGTNPKPLRRRGFCFWPPAQRQRRAAEKTGRRNWFYRSRTCRGFAGRPDRQQHAHSRTRSARATSTPRARCSDGPMRFRAGWSTGDRLGQQLGFPTANLDVTGLVLPPNGVYAGLANCKRKSYRVALNIGFRPTVASARATCSVEAHLLDFNGNLYGEELEVEIGEMLREEKKFSSTIELREQIARDIAAVPRKLDLL